MKKLSVILLIVLIIPLCVFRPCRVRIPSGSTCVYVTSDVNTWGENLVYNEYNELTESETEELRQYIQSRIFFYWPFHEKTDRPLAYIVFTTPDGAEIQLDGSDISWDLSIHDTRYTTIYRSLEDLPGMLSSYRK